jgi:hypothetical protein
MTLNGSVQSAWTVISIAGSPRLYLSSSGVSAAQIDGWAVPTGWQNVRWQQNYGVDNKIKFWAQGDPEPSGWTLIQTTTGQTAGVYSSFSVDVQGDSTMTSDFEVWYDALNVPDLNRCTAVHLDDFEGRTVSPGWGTSSSGPVWNPSAHANTSVSSGIGTLDLRGLGNPTTGALVEKVVAPSILPVTLHDVWRTNRNYTDVPYISTGNNNENYWNFENSGGSETIRVDFQYWSNGTHSIHAVLLVISRIGSGTTFAQQIFTDSSAAAALFGGSPVVTSLLPRAVANTWYERKIRLTNGVGVQWKIWESGTTEPDWTTSTVIVPNNFSLNDASLQLANPGSGTNSTNDLLYETQYIDLGAETPCADVPPADPVNAVISGKTCTDFDGGTDTFQLPNDVYSGTVEVYVNGLLQPLSEVTSSTTGLIVLSYTTASTDKVRICYEIRDFNK